MVSEEYWKDKLGFVLALQWSQCIYIISSGCFFCFFICKNIKEKKEKKRYN